MAPDLWGAKNRIYPPHTGVPGPRDPKLTPYMIPLERAAYEGRYKRVVGITAAQSGKTEAQLDLIGARMDQKPAPVIYVGPSKEFLVNQFEPRLMSLMDEAETLSKKVLRGKRMRQTLKRVSGVPIRLAHAGSSTALKSDPAALALVDEYDEMLENIKQQGEPLGLVEARGDTYADFVAVVTSTCSTGICETETDPVSGLEFWKVGDPLDIQSGIWKLFQDGTRYHWAWPCPECETYFIPRAKHLKFPENSTAAQAGKAAYLECPHCEAHLRDDRKAWMNARGVMVAPGQQINGAGEVIGDPPESKTCSFWTSGLASPFVTWGERAEQLREAEISGDPAKLQTAMNAGFGELYALDGGGEVPEWQEVFAKKRPYHSGTAPVEAIRLVAGVDVQKSSLVYVLRAFGYAATSWLVEAGQIAGRTDEKEVWDKLEQLLMRSHGGLRVEQAYIDAGFRPDKPDGGTEHSVYAFCRNWRGYLWPTKGRDTMTGPLSVSKIDVKPDGKRVPYSLNLVHVNTDFFKSLVHSRIRKDHGAPGSLYLPEDITEDYCRQLVSEARIIGANGKPKWVRRSRANHFFDCEVLAAVAAYRLKLHEIPEGVLRSRPPGADTASTGQAAVPSAEAPRPSNLRDRIASRASRLNKR